MACQMCHIETTATLCRVCRYLAEMAPPTFPKVVICRHCQAPIAKPEETGTLCRLCRELLRSVRQSSWLAFAHAEWEQENYLLAKRKQELI